MPLRGSALAQLAVAVARASTTEELLDAVPVWAREPLRCAYCVVSLVERDHTIVFDRSGIIDGATERDWVRLPIATTTGIATIDAIRTGESLWSPDMEDYRKRFPASVDNMVDGGFQSICALPLRDSRGEVIGAFTVCWATPFEFDTATVDTIVTVAEIIGLAIERTRAGDSRDIISAGLAHLASAFSAAKTNDEVARVVPDLISELLGSRLALVSMIDHDRGVLYSPYQGEGIADTPLSSYADLSLDAELAPRSYVARTGESLLIPDIEVYRDTYPDGVGVLSGAGIASVAMLAMRESSGAVLGVLAVGWGQPTDFDDGLTSLLQTVADLCGQTIERTTLYDTEHALVQALAESEARGREVAETLQRSLLPATLPEFDRLDIAVRYRPGVEGLEVGGDWYDVLALPDGRAGVCVGDVVGRGIHAASAMGQLRSALNALAPYSDDPAILLDRLDAFAQPNEAARYATVAYGILDPVTRNLTYSCAGHPPPLVVPAEGPATFLDQGRSTPLTATTASGRKSAEVGLPPGARLVLYSDGLIERRGESITRGLERLAEASAQHRKLPLESFCDQILKDLLVGVDHHDDVVMLVTEARPPRSGADGGSSIGAPGEVAATAGGPSTRAVPGFHYEIDARPERLSTFRRSLRAWLVSTGITRGDADDIVLACSEATNNAVEHAYSERTRTARRVTIDGTATADGIQLTIADEGAWREPIPDPERGRGLLIMHALMSEVDVSRTPTGTTVTMAFRPPTTGSHATARTKGTPDE